MKKPPVNRMGNPAAATCIRAPATARLRAAGGKGILPALIVAVAILAPGCTGNGEDGRPSRAARRELTPAERGEMRARRHIEEGKMRVLRYGNPLSRRNPKVDRESGLPVRILIDCCVSAEATEETDAYNRVMRERARQKRGKNAPPRRLGKSPPPWRHGR